MRSEDACAGATSYLILPTFYFLLVFHAAKVRYFSIFHFSVLHEFRRFRAVVGDDLQEVNAGVEGGDVQNPL